MAICREKRVEKEMWEGVTCEEIEFERKVRE